MATRFTAAESDGIKRARSENSAMSQRALAKMIYASAVTGNQYSQSLNRSEAAIYNLVRRLDAANGVKNTRTSKRYASV